MKKYLFFIIGIGMFGGTLLFGFDASALTLRTIRIEEQIVPGGQIAELIKVQNDQDEEITIYPNVVGFTDSGDESGHPLFIPIDPDVYDLPNWIAFNNEFTVLQPGEEVEIPFVINIPENASPGGHYATIFLSLDPANKRDGSQVVIGTKVGTLVIIDVIGEVEEDASIVSFETFEGYWYNYLPVTFVTRINNEGNVHFKPQGVIKIKNMLGITTATIPANFVQGNVLPNSIRRIEDIWEKNELQIEGGFWNNVKNEFFNFGLGRYSANIEIDLGRDESHIVTEKVAFWVIPWRLILLTIFLITVLFTLVKLYDQSVVRRASRVLQQQRSAEKKKKVVRRRKK